MNLRAKVTIKSILFLLAGGSLLLVAIFMDKRMFRPTKGEVVLGEDEIISFQREFEYQEISPDGKNLVLLYRMPFHPGMYDHYYDYLSGQLFVAVKETASGRENYIPVTEYRSGNPHWLGNHHIYFTVHCGTACKGIQLAGIGGRNSELGVISYIYNSETKRQETYFKDWFDQEFIFEGLVDEVKSEVVGGEAYLIFKMKDDGGNFLYEKRFLFTEGGLEAVD